MVLPPLFPLPSSLFPLLAHAAAVRIARFHTSNEFSDWDTALHTFTFAHAVCQMLARAPTVELLRGVFDAAMSVYLDRFLAAPGEVLVTGTVRDLVTGAGFRFADRGEHELRGVPGRWRLLAVHP
jgi:hypothetical protein